MLFVDASTLILAAKTELLDLFIGASHEPLAISAEVVKEATRKKTFDALLIMQRIDEKRISVKNVKGTLAVKRIMGDFNLHKGEAETIALCLENKGSAIATDDYNAMKACSVLNIEYATSLGILLSLYKHKRLGKEQAELKLDGLVRCGRYSDEIIADFRKRLEG